MRTSKALDLMLENAVAEALGLDRPHPEAPRRLRMSRRIRPVRRPHHALVAPRHDRVGVAA